MRHLLIGLLAFLLFLLVASYAASYGWGADPSSIYAIPEEPEIDVPVRSPIPRLAPRLPFSYNTLYDGRTQRVSRQQKAISLPEEQTEADPPLIYKSNVSDPIGNVRQLSLPARTVYDPLRGRDRMSINPVEQALQQQGYDVAGKLPILPQKRDAKITDAAGNVLPSRDPLYNTDTPIIGNQRTTRNMLQRNRLSATERTEQQLYRGPSHPGMIAPRAQQQRSTPSARDLGRKPN
ncbi:hypothetical protein [Blastopirellula marina]|uniref:Uncharacterized protein n=1 Tax=Blastopirellula marina TaxID=124 RepID=A0A2S8FLP2_9BACT|nr:hypothetical protein [Blastopirellula marina]PQO33086.1 hypothetical protein C5Y98_18300 [Blastopirellula marina]PTL43253.1 hypothetical protein C5Y97_18310 [Blastopirellula marina]